MWIRVCPASMPERPQPQTPTDPAASPRAGPDPKFQCPDHLSAEPASEAACLQCVPAS